jgi:hypothetical protein
MVSRQYSAVLDACVLAPMPLADTLLRLAEESFFVPKWSAEILHEVGTTLAKFGYSVQQIERRTAAIRTGADVIVSNNKRHFPKALLDQYGLECLTGDEFLVGQYYLNTDAFMEVLRKQAAIIGRGLPEHLATLARHAPALGALIRP